MMDAPRIFEELSFIWELLAAEYVLLLPFARRKTGSWVPLLTGIPVFSLLSFGFFVLRSQQNAGMLPQGVFQYVFMLWYILLALLTMLFARVCFQLTVSDALYICIAGYSLRHVIYVLVHELLARVLWPWLPDHLALYALIDLAACTALLTLVHLCFAPQLRLCGGRMFPDTPRTIATHVVLLAALMFCTFSCQHVFENWEGQQALGAQMGLAMALLMLCLQYGSLRAVRAGQERASIEQMLRDSANHYALTREMVEHINRTCHDLKHTLGVLKTVGEEERQGFIEQAERNIERYHQLVHTDNEVLNTVLAEKSLYCDSKKIRLSTAVDSLKLPQLDIPDLCALLGNAIDNAIECVDRFDDPDRRVISLTIRKQNAFVCIQTNNYCDEALELENGLPRTTKADKAGHGFGLKSIRYLAEKYGGRMCVSVQDHIFILQIMLSLS